MYKKLILVAGHGRSNGRYDSGAVAKDGTHEREIAKRIGIYTEEFFKEWKNNFVKTVGVHKDVDLKNKIWTINQYCQKKNLNFSTSLLISIHCDWSGAKEGVGGYFYRGSSESREFLKTVSEEVAKIGNRKNLYQKPDTNSRFGQLGIIKNTEPLAILIEAGSLKSDSNKLDGLELLKSDKGQRDIAFAIFKGVLRFMGEELPEKKKECKNEEQENLLKEIAETNSKEWIYLEDKKAELTDRQEELESINKKIKKACN